MRKNTNITYIIELIISNYVPKLITSLFRHFPHLNHTHLTKRCNCDIHTPNVTCITPMQHEKIIVYIFKM